MSTATQQPARRFDPSPLLRGLRLVWESAAGWTVAQFVLLAIQGLLPLAILYLMKLIVDAVSAAVVAPDPTAAFDQVIRFVLLAAGVALATAGLRVVSTLVSEVQALKVTDRVHDVLHEKSVAIDLSYYENPKYHNTLHRAQMEAPYRPTRIVSELAQIGQSGISLVVVTGLLLSFHWIVAVVLLVAAVPGMLVKVRFSRRLYNWQQRQTPTQRRTRYYNLLLTMESFAKEIRLFSLGPLFRERFREMARRLREERLAIVQRRSVLDLGAQAFTVVAVFGIFALVAWRTVTGAITLGDMVMYFGAFQRAQDFLRELMNGLAGLYEDNLFLADLNEFLALTPQVKEPVRPAPFPRPIRQGIVMDGVTFRYPDGTRDVLSDISLEIRPGEHVALVGENGSGKTTLVKLLCRLYDPSAGGIRIDGIDLRDFETRALRGEISVTFQDYAKYQLTARENIWLGNVELPPDSPRVLDAAAQTGAHRVIEQLPQRLDTVLGRQFEQGAELSIGEWQKIALARAFVRDSQIIVLDEPTAALDARSEAEVFERFHQLASGRTAILISHRLSTVRMADRIIVLHDGRVVESGRHDELVLRGGTYAELFDLQARYYR
ncbi:MAG: ABC transporter ATP-binding protein/permease [Gemmatimonadetes bacterium]|nr:ABC transporter ATP-binding protein/permease [Gemmatimonadota bacterium]